MDWQSGISVLGIGLAIATWAFSMIWPMIPRRIAFVLLFLGVTLMLVWPAASIWNYIAESLPKLELYFNDRILDGQKISVKVERHGDSPVIYDIALGQFEVRERDRKTEAQGIVPRLRLSGKDLFCYIGCGSLEPSVNEQYPIVYRGQSFSLHAGDKTFFQTIILRSKSPPPSLILAQLEMLYGQAEKVRADFIIIVERSQAL